MKEIAKKSKLRICPQNQIDQDKQKLMNCLCIKRGILRLWASCRLKFEICRSKSIRCQMRENATILDREHLWNDPRSQATSNILSPRTVPRCGSGLPHDTRNSMVTSGNVFWTTTCLRKTICYRVHRFKKIGDSRKLNEFEAEVEATIKKMNLNDFSYIKQVDGQIRLSVAKSAFMENWNWEIDSSKKIMQDIDNKLQNC